MGGKSKAAAVNVGGQLPANNGGVANPILPCQANNDPRLKVKVWGKIEGKKRYVQATVTAGALTHASVAPTGIADFSYVDVGAYPVSVNAGDILAPDDADFYSPATVQTVTLNKGDNRSLEIEVKPRNVVTPKLEVEYKVVVFDRDLAQHQIVAGEPADDLLRPEPTYVEVSLTCSGTDPAYTGEGTFAAANCAIFLDAACTQPLGGRKLTNAELTARSPMKLYLRGTTRGLFTASLTLDPAPDARFVVKPPATQDMGVVEIQLEVHQHVTPVNVAATTYPLTNYCADLENVALIPDQVILSDLEKVTEGRVLHKQVKGNNGRAKAILKLTAAEWPAGTDDYKIVLSTKPNDLRAYDAEIDGAREALPFKPTVAQLKGAPKTLWIEGASSSSVIRGVRLSVGLDRDSGGLSKSQKHNADWARFTVVTIDSVKLVYVQASGQPKQWNPNKHRWYINYLPGVAGRTVKIKAKLSKPIEGIKLCFMLSPDKNNLKEANWGVDLPATWNWDAATSDVKQKDKVNTTDLLHMIKETDAQGEAECDTLVLSAIGGDKFWPAVYIRQDPHLAAYVHGHATLEERKPKIADDPIKVWRRFAYVRIKAGGRRYPSLTTAVDVYGRIRARMIKRPPVVYSQNAVRAMARPSLLPEYMFKVNGSDSLRLNVSDANMGQFFGGVGAEAEHPIKVPIITCDFNWANERNSAVVANFDRRATAFPVNVGTDVHVCDPPLQGGALLVSGDWVAAEWDPAANAGAGNWANVRNGALANGDVDIDKRRNSINAVRVNLPAAVGATTADTKVWIRNLVVQGAPDDYLGGYSNNQILALYDPTNPVDYQNTIVHELGHAFFQTLQNQAWAGLPNNTNFIQDPTGPHCTYNTDKCVMFTSGPIAGSLNRYCPDCHPHMLVQDMSALS